MVGNRSVIIAFSTHKNRVIKWKLTTGNKSAVLKLVITTQLIITSLVIMTSSVTTSSVITSPHVDHNNIRGNNNNIIIGNNNILATATL